MTEAKTILKMIETVDRADTAKLDEIDALTWCWIAGKEFYVCERDPATFKPIAYEFSEPLTRQKQTAPEYTRSRDALKGIRPKGYRFAHLNPPDGFFCVGDGPKQVRGPSWNHLSTEELAELTPSFRLSSMSAANRNK